MINNTSFYKRGIKAVPTLAAIGALAFSSPVQAKPAVDENALIEGAKMCTRYLPRHERQYGIPEHLLAAIASTESGRFHRGLGLNLPWPWTINVNGRGYFFDTKEEAVAAVNKLRSEGYTSIDVGCMQVNLHHHPKAFSSIEQAFDPAYNIGYAADFLKRNFMEEGSWRKATADYHSRTASYGASYSQQVFGAWSRIVTKVADARAGRPVLTNYASTTTPRVQRGGKPVVMASRVRPSYRSVRMHSITLASRNTASRENGVLVIRPEKEQPSIIQAQNTPDPLVIKSDNLRVASTSSIMPSTVAEPAAAASKGIKVVNLAGKGASRGQFEPRFHTATVDTSAATPAKTGNKLFVFDN